MLKIDSTNNRQSVANMSFKHYLPSLCSPMVAMADPSENVVDGAWMSPALLAVILTTG